jgi:hypothetical protein
MLEVDKVVLPVGLGWGECEGGDKVGERVMKRRRRTQHERKMSKEGTFVPATNLFKGVGHDKKVAVDGMGGFKVRLLPGRFGDIELIDQVEQLRAIHRNHVTLEERPVHTEHVDLVGRGWGV